MMKMKLFVLLIFLASPALSIAQEMIVLHKVMTRIGHDGHPVMLKGVNDGCNYVGKASSQKLGIAEIIIERKFCNNDGTPKEIPVSLQGKANSEFEVNQRTGEKVNSLPAGTKINLIDHSSTST